MKSNNAKHKPTERDKPYIQAIVDQVKQKRIAATSPKLKEQINEPSAQLQHN